MFKFFHRIVCWVLNLFFPNRHYLCPISCVQYSMEADPKKLRNYITTVLTFKEEIKFAEFSRYTKERIKEYIPFRSRMVRTTFTFPYYQEIKDFKFETRFFEETLPPNAGAEDLLKRSSEIGNAPGNADHPLYSFHLLHGYKGAGCAIIVKIHHAVFDGSMAVKFLFHLTDRKEKYVHVEPTAEEKKERERKRKIRAKKYPKPNIFQAIWLFISRFFAMLTVPIDPKEQIFGHRGGIRDIDLKGYINLDEEVQLVDVKKIARKYDCTINDVIESSFAGGVRKYLLLYGTENDRENLRKKKSVTKSVTWVNRRKESFPQLIRRLCRTEPVKMDHEDFSLDFGVIYRLIPYHIEDHVKRLKACNDELKRMLNSPDHIISGGLMTMMGCLPPFIARLVWEKIGYKFSISVSNVPGPQHVRQYCGKDMEQMGFYSTPAGTISQMVTVFSYNNKFYNCLYGIFSEEETKKVHECVMDSIREHLQL